MKVVGNLNMGFIRCALFVCLFFKISHESLACTVKLEECNWNYSDLGRYYIEAHFFDVHE